jgi:cyclophilin family peptidyl-prolyl cis-trans isomerase
MPHKKHRISKRKSQRNWLIAIVLLIILLVSAVVVYYQFFNKLTGQTKVLLVTSLGDITIDLRTDKPITSANFRNLVEQGKYDGSKFDRILAGFVVQAGKIGGTFAKIPDEIGSNNRNTAYTVAMAKTDQPNSATTEFFINLVDNGNQVIDAKGTKFDSVYTVFGTVISGKEVVDLISQQQVQANPTTGEVSQPLTTITIFSASMIS